MTDITHIFGGPWSPPPEKPAPRIDPPEVQLRDAMLRCGLTPPDQIIFDGQLHRFASGTKGKPGKTDKPGWYVAYNDGIPAGAFGCWRAGIEETWRADIGRQLSMAEHIAQTKRLTEAKQKREAEQAKAHDIAANDVVKIWYDGAIAGADHPYLKRKGIQPHGARVTGDGRLMVPLYDDGGELISLQYIAALPDGSSDKKYHPGAQTKGGTWWIGSVADATTVYIAEGFATAATIYDTTQCPVIIAYSASGLVDAVRIAKQKTSADVVIVADHDKSGVGQKYADQAAAKYGARVVIPPIEGMDANDYAQSGHDLAALLIQPSGQDVIDKLKVVFGDQLGSDYEAPDELVEGLMTMGSLTVIYGDSNSGKTFWALSVATAIATGSLCYGRKTDPGLVVYLASEAPASIRSRMQAIKKFHGCTLENLAMVPVPMNFYSGNQDANDVIELVRTIEKIKGKPVRLIIGDTLARMSAGANENSGEDMGPVMARFDQVATATGAAMMIIHHNGKDSAKGARGWSGIRAHIDTEIEVVEKDGVRSVTVTKQRELPSKGDAICFKLEVIEMGVTKFGEPATTCVAVPDEAGAVKTKKPTKHDENMRTLERSWWASGAEERNGLPYISKSALRDFLIKNGYSERTAKNKTDASRSDGLIAPLLNAGVLETFEHGWILINQAQVSALLMQKNTPKNLP